MCARRSGSGSPPIGTLTGPFSSGARRLADSGWAAPSWPIDCFGRGLSAEADGIVAEELARAGAVGVPVGVGIGLAAPTILAHGAPELKATLLRRILTGEDMWCQLFSEPGSGSDLAGLTTRADLDGDEWVVNGQKVWNTSAHHAELGLLLARTELGRDEAQGDHLLRRPDAAGGRRGAAIAADERTLVVQRGLLQRRTGARRQRDRGTGRGVGRGRHDVDVRAAGGGPAAAAVRGPRRAAPCEKRSPRPTSTSPPTRGTRSAPAGPTW